MRSPTTAIVWQCFARYRWFWLAGVAYFVIVVLMGLVLPAGSVFNAVRYVLAVPLALAPVLVCLTFTVGADGDMASRESVYPTRMFTLPVGSRTLVGLPIFFGAATMATVCLVIGFFVVRAIVPDSLLLRPTLLLTACLAWFQTIQWASFGLRWLRVVVVVAAIAVLVWVPALAEATEPPGAWLDLLLTAQIPIAYALAIRGVCRARSGSGPDWQWIPDRITLAGLRSSGPSRPFLSALQAQRWFEWRMRGPALLVAIGLAVSFLTPCMLYCGTSVVAERLPVFAHPAFLLVVPLLVALMMGLAFGDFNSERRSTNGCPSFLATRPMDCTDFVRAKFGAARTGVLAMYALVVPTTVLLMVCLQDFKGLDAVFAGFSSPVERIVVGLGGLVLLVATAWVLLVENLLFNLTGRKWVIVAISIAGPTLFYGLLFLGWWISTWHRENVETILALVPWLLGVLIALKLALAIWVLQTLCRRRLLSTAGATRLSGLWLVVLAVLISITEWLVPPGLVARPTLFFGTILAVPAVRLGLAPLALAWNRHR